MLLRKRQKVSKFCLLVFRQKLENRPLHAENDFFKIFGKKCTYGDFDENFSKFARCLGVKGIFFVEIQIELRAIEWNINKKTTCEDQDGTSTKIFNNKTL